MVPPSIYNATGVRVKPSMVMIVEDDAFIRELTEMTIQDWGYTTCSAGGLEEALALLRSKQPFRVLFTDINLNGAAFGGCELAQLAIGIRPGLHVLYTTGNQITKQIIDQFVPGSTFLRKPYTSDQLRKSVEYFMNLEITPI